MQQKPVLISYFDYSLEKKKKQKSSEPDTSSAKRPSGTSPVISK